MILNVLTMDVKQYSNQNNKILDNVFFTGSHFYSSFVHAY